VLLAAACGTIQGLDGYENVDCLEDTCDASANEAAAPPPDVVDTGTTGDAGNGSNDGAIASGSAIGGAVFGLVGSGLELVDMTNGEKLLVGMSGPFTFMTRFEPGASYDVKVSKQPVSPAQPCVVVGGTGVVGTGDVTSIVVNCDPDKHTISGSVSGLASGTVFLKNNGGDIVQVNAPADPSTSPPFTFPTPLAGGSDYDVTVAAQPVGLTCLVQNPSGKVGTTDVTGIKVDCTKNTYYVGGTISGLVGSVVLKNNGVDAFTQSTNTGWQFPTKVAFGAPYAVSVGTQPPNQNCTVMNATGTVGAYDVTTVQVTCTTLDAGSNCGATNTTTNCSACGATCDTTFSNTASCNGTTCSYASCKSGRLDCNTSAPNTNGCECASPGCCVNGASGSPGPTATCQPQHNDGVGESFYDCTPLGTYTVNLAMAACAAETGNIAQCAASQCVGVAGGKFGIVCSSGASTCTCWNYEGTYAGYVRTNSTSSCYCAGSNAYPTWQ